MKALVVHDLGGPFVMEERPEPEAGHGEAVARIMACGMGLTIQHTRMGRGRSAGRCNRWVELIPGGFAANERDCDMAMVVSALAPCQRFSHVDRARLGLFTSTCQMSFAQTLNLHHMREFQPDTE